VVPTALLKLGYGEEQAAEIVSYIDQHGTIEGAPGLKPEHLPVFDCSLKPANGTRAIHYMGHVRMMAAVQPFLSGAISKTVNMPEEATVEEVANVYIQAWRLGLKAIAIYRDGSKRTQPLNTKKQDSGFRSQESEKQDSGFPHRWGPMDPIGVQKSDRIQAPHPRSLASSGGQSTIVSPRPPAIVNPRPPAPGTTTLS
jgi:ribonucleotide reductase alpha subunit